MTFKIFFCESTGLYLSKNVKFHSETPRSIVGCEMLTEVHEVTCWSCYLHPGTYHCLVNSQISTWS